MLQEILHSLTNAKMFTTLHLSKGCQHEIKQQEDTAEGNSKDGLKPDPEKMKAVKEMPKPTCKKEVLSLLGFVNYLAKFMPKLSKVAQPLRDLTCAHARFVWSKQHDKAFEEIKQLAAKAPILKYYNVEEEVTLQCDASERGLGAALLQNGQLVAFAS